MGYQGTLFENQTDYLEYLDSLNMDRLGFIFPVIAFISLIDTILVDI